MNYSTQIKQSNTDEWYTTEESVRMIIPYLYGRYKKILCPFDKKESNFNKVLSKHGFDVTYSHIDTGTDFFEIDNLKDYDAIVSNPPFSKREKILEKLFESDVPFAIIMNFNGLFDKKSRWELFKRNEFELLVPLGRMHFFNDNGFHNSPSFQSIWVCKGICDKQIIFDDMRGDTE